MDLYNTFMLAFNIVFFIVNIYNLSSSYLSPTFKLAIALVMVVQVVLAIYYIGELV